MNEVKWYARGEMGEYVLEVVEGAINESINADQFIHSLRKIGLDEQEIMNVYAGEVLGV
jgi:hypothetical protein